MSSDASATINVRQQHKLNTWYIVDKFTSYPWISRTYWREQFKNILTQTLCFKKTEKETQKLYFCITFLKKPLLRKKNPRNFFILQKKIFFRTKLLLDIFSIFLNFSYDSYEIFVVVFWLKGCSRCSRSNRDDPRGESLVDTHFRTHLSLNRAPGIQGSPSRTFYPENSPRIYKKIMVYLFTLYALLNIFIGFFTR